MAVMALSQVRPENRVRAGERTALHEVCCTSDGGRSSGLAEQAESPNHRKLLRSRAVVVSVAGKARYQRVR